MTEMVRKQIYIHRRQADWLTRLAAARGISEAEVVRQAIEHEVAGSRTVQAQSNLQAWQAALDFAIGRRQSETSADPYQWHREDAYESRNARYAE